ncbi:hypothetical protein HYT00_02735 [Candidatus Giovannonibacteria bacterium]|nr:hypothetical protein [Candidatus Giovannonibacteria bacterium]
MKPKKGEIIVGFIPAFIIIAIIFTSGVAGFFYTKELEKSEYFLELNADRDNEYATMLRQKRDKENIKRCLEDKLNDSIELCQSIQTQN